MSKSKVFCLGLPKTGTSTITAILKRFGYKTSHWIWGTLDKAFANPERIDNYDAVTDFPIPIMYRHLDIRYPDAKFILTEREIESYIRSARHHFVRPYNSIMYFGYGIRRWNESAHRKIFLDHSRSVVQYFQDWYPDTINDKLLIINICDGKEADEKWQAIADFLKVPCPQKGTPFPWENKNRKLHE